MTITDASAALGICSPLNGSGLNVGEEMVCPATHVITSADVVSQSYTNTATADSTETIPLTDTVTVQITQNPAMEIYKTVTSDGPYLAGSLVTFDISVINTGDVTLHNVQIAEVTRRYNTGYLSARNSCADLGSVLYRDAHCNSRGYVVRRLQQHRLSGQR